MLTRLHEDADYAVEGKMLFEMFDLETKIEGIPWNNKSRVFYEFLTKVFPNAVKHRKSTAHETKTLYKGINTTPPNLDNFTEFQTLADVKHHLPNDFVIEDENENSVSLKHFTGYCIDDHQVFKEIELCKDGSWKLKMCGKLINLSSLYVSEKFQYTKESIAIVCRTVKILKLCAGVTINSSVIVTRFHLYQRIEESNGIKKRVVRSILCDQIVALNTIKETCKKCLKMTLHHPEKESKKIVNLKL